MSRPHKHPTHSPSNAHLNYLAKEWALLRLTVEAPDLFPTWDVILLTSATESQARLYEVQCRAAQRRGLIPPHTLILVAPDPQGTQIGDGGATLNALRLLGQTRPSFGLSRLRVLIVHAGGDSQRLPWASHFGKPFVPFPLLADPDRGVPTLFDHLLAVAASLAVKMHRGGLLVLPGDALTLFDTSSVVMPTDGCLVVTTPVSTDISEQRGVVVANEQGTVINLFHNASVEELHKAGALVEGGATLLDTGIFAFLGTAYEGLLELANSEPNPVEKLLEEGHCCGLHEEVAAAMVPDLDTWLRDRPLGNHLLAALWNSALIHHRAEDMGFVPFESTGELLQHFEGYWQGKMSRRILAEVGSGVDETALIYVSQLGQGTLVGPESLVYGCCLGDQIRVGRRCVAFNVDAGYEPFSLPDNCCLWQVPILSKDGAEPSVVTVCCGVDDNPKETLKTATFCNRLLSKWLQTREVQPDALWKPGEKRTLWTARLFPSGSEGLAMVSWLLAPGEDSEAQREAWLAVRRYSLAELIDVVEAESMMQRHEDLVTDLVLHAIGQTVRGGLERDVRALASLLKPSVAGEHLTSIVANLPTEAPQSHLGLPASRFFQIKADLMHACGAESEAEEWTLQAREAVRNQVTSSLRIQPGEPVSDLSAGDGVQVEMPLAFDFAGGGSDVPPLGLERPARVLNMAIILDGRLPVGASVEVLSEPHWSLVVEGLGERTFRDSAELSTPSDPRDPFSLLRGALCLAGYGTTKGITQGVRLVAWAHVPRDSGLGTNGILGATILTALQRLAGRPSDAQTITELALMLEQKTGTGAGWQESIGCLFPGIKWATSLPISPLRVNVESVPMLRDTEADLQRRLLLIHTGTERSVKDLNLTMVDRYLRRDRTLLGIVGRLVALADDARKALCRGDLDDLGHVFSEIWEVQQELDPQAAATETLQILQTIQDLSVGAKLAGAGGTGCMGILARSEEAAGLIRARLTEVKPDVHVYDWMLHTLYE